MWILILTLLTTAGPALTSAEFDNYYSDKFNELKLIMSDNVGIKRTKDKLLYALNLISKIQNEVIAKNTYSQTAFELISALFVAKEITKSALSRENSIGAHFRDDYKNKPEISKEEGKLEDNEKVFA